MLQTESVTHVDNRRYTGAADAALIRAATLAAAWNHPATAPIAVLSALVDAEATGMAVVILASNELGERRNAVRHAIARQLPALGAAPLGPVLDHAMSENPTRPIGTDHLLLGLLEADSSVAELLATAGITATAVRSARAAALDTVCYGCAEADRRPTRYAATRSNLPPELTAVLDDVVRWRTEKEHAVDAGDFGRAGRMRDQERSARSTVATWDETRLIAHFGSAIDEILRLRSELDHLITQLHTGHAIDGPT